MKNSVSYFRLAGSTLALVIAFAAASRAQSLKNPNIVMIISDDHAWGDYSFMGHPHIRTPNLDRLASQSLVFTRGYVTSSLCSPSLASIITGLYPHQHKITSNDPPLPPGKKGPAANSDPGYRELRQEMIRFIDQVPTLPRLLARKGYVSLQTGKWWMGNYRRGGFSEGMSTGDPDKGGRHGDEGLKIGRETLQPVFDFIARAAGENKPFFVWYAPMLPHQPHDPPERLLDKYKDKAPSLPVARYWAMIERFDETCGQLLGYLDQKGLAENTFIIYLADNGWIQDPKADRYAARSKQSQYDGGLRTPILLRWPVRVKPQRSDRLAISIDFVPTLLAAVSLEPTPEMQGINLLNENPLKNRRAIFGECFTHNAVDIHRPASNLRWRWMIEGDWKLIVPAQQNEPNGIPELFNLSSDPTEEANLAERDPRTLDRLTKLLNQWWPGKP